MDLATFRNLLTPLGQEVLQAATELAPVEEDFLRHFTSLSRHYPVELTRLALGIAILRKQGERKFPFASQLYFTREALEQASSWEVSSYRAQRYRGFSQLIDLGCSVGSDTLALAQIAPTIGLDLDPLRLAMAQANLAALGLSASSLIQADLQSPLPISHSPSPPALFFDPARRARHRRAFSVRDYQPPLAIIKEWLPRFPALGVKISPGVNLNELTPYDAEIEFISLNGDLKEAVLWFGPLQSAYRRATLLPGGHTLFTDTSLEMRQSIDEPRAFLYEPDPAVLRAGLVVMLGAQLNAAQLDPDIAYLTAHEYKATPFAKAWEVEAWFPFGLKRLRAYLRQRHVGRVTVKKRGSPLEPETLISELRLSGDEERTIFLTHLRGKPIVVIGWKVED